MIKRFHMFLIFIQFSTYYANEIRICGKLALASHGRSCAPWPNFFCPNSTYLPPKGIQPGRDQIELSGKLMSCEAGFDEFLLCDSADLPMESSGKFRICRGDFSREVGGFGENLRVKMMSGTFKPISRLKENDMIWGKHGEDLTDAFCKVTAVVPQGPHTLAGNLSDSQMIWTESGLEMNGAVGNEPSIHHERRNSQTYQVFSNCELVHTEENGVLSPISGMFCGKKKMAWQDYVILYKSVSSIIKQTGKFWLNIKNYKDCSENCTFSTWRSALPPICESLISCARDRAESHCQRLEILTNIFAKEYLNPPYSQQWFTSFSDISFPTFIKRQILSKPGSVENIDTEEDGDFSSNFSAKWNDPWIWILVAVAFIFILSVIIYTVHCDCDCCDCASTDCCDVEYCCSCFSYCFRHNPSYHEKLIRQPRRYTEDLTRYDGDNTYQRSSDIDSES